MSEVFERIVLDDSVTATQVEASAQEWHWTPLADVTRAHEVLAHKRWETPSRREVTYVEDHTGDVRFIDVRGQDEPGPQSHASLVMDLRRRLPTFELRDLLTTAERSDHPRVLLRTLSRLAVLRPPEPDTRWLEIWQRALAHDSVVVRRAAIRTAYGCTWQELPGLVEARLPRETGLRPAFGQLLDHLRRSATAARHPGS